MATAISYPYEPRASLPANVQDSTKRSSDCGSGIYLMSGLPLLFLLAEALAGAWLWYSLQSMWSWPLIIVFALVASFALSVAALLNLTAIGVALLSLAAREGNVISRTAAGLGLVANVVALLPIAWILGHWLVR